MLKQTLTDKIINLLKHILSHLPVVHSNLHGRNVEMTQSLSALHQL